MGTQREADVSDLFVIGGGVNGAAIARDAVGRGLSVRLAEANDLASATSSSSTKLFHGGLRYLEFFEFRLVRHALAERETLLKAMPHISWPLRFVLPFHPGMRFDTSTPASRLVSRFMPWLKGRRPGWMIRLGLFLYDHLGGREILPGTASIDLRDTPEGQPLKPEFKRAYEYSDCWVDDSRLVVLLARDAAERGAQVLTRHRVIHAERGADMWTITCENLIDGGTVTFQSRAIVNAGGPWVSEILKEKVAVSSRESIRLVRGSHIVTRKLYDHDKCYFFQGRDGRIIFAIPYEDDFTLIGTTDSEHDGDPSDVHATEAEQDYLCDFASEFFRQPVTRDDVVRTFSGVRPLYDDGAKSATAATRDYVLSLNEDGAPLLSIFGGKITTHRKLAEEALDRLSKHLPEAGGHWTAGAALPGGDFPVDGVEALVSKLGETAPFVDDTTVRRLVRAYGTQAFDIIGDAKRPEDLGRDFGAGLTEREVTWLMRKEFARTAEDIVWRRSKLGLRMTSDEIAALDQWMVGMARTRAAE